MTGNDWRLGYYLIYTCDTFSLEKKVSEKLRFPLTTPAVIYILTLPKAGNFPGLGGLRLLRLLRLLCASLGSLTISAHAYEQASAALLLVTYDSKGACEYIEKSENGNDIR